jgi:hypothetical protein
MLVEKSITTEGLREDTWSVLEAMAREGARKVLQQALEIEVAEYIEAHAGKRNEKSHRRVVRNGSMPERSILTGMGPNWIRQPRVDDRGLRSEEETERFSSRTVKTKGCGSRTATLTMVFKLVRECQKNWRRLTGSSIIPLVLAGRKFVDGVLDGKAA